MATCAVTGSTRGIGFATAERLLADGHTVIVTGRNIDDAAAACQRIGNGNNRKAVPAQLDVSEPDSINGFAERLGREFGVVDVLVNNAAQRIESYGTAPSDQSIDLWIETFHVNLFGTVSLTKAMLPLLTRSEAPRIVNVSSLLGSLTAQSDSSSYTYADSFKSLPAYSASKTALNSWTVHLAYQFRNSPLKVNSAHPGYSKTDMNGGEGECTAHDGSYTPYRLATLGQHGPTGGFFHQGDVVPW